MDTACTPLRAAAVILTTRLPVNDPPSVTIVVAFHNVRKFLSEAIESVLLQSYPDWELLLVDDGSSDGTDRIAREYAERHDRIRYLHHAGRANRGISATRNLGLAHARGEYVAQLDADDVWSASHLEHLVRILEAHPDAAMVYGPVERWYSWTGNGADATRDFIARPLNEYDTYIDPPALVSIMLQLRFGVPLGFVARKRMVEAVGGYEDEFRGMYDDQVFFCKLGLRYRVYVASECSYRYRRHPESIVWLTNRTGEQLANRLRFLNWLAAYLTEQGIRDRRVWRPLEQELWKCYHPRLTGYLERIEKWNRRVRRRLQRMWSGDLAVSVF